MLSTKLIELLRQEEAKNNGPVEIYIDRYNPIMYKNAAYPEFWMYAGPSSEITIQKDSSGIRPILCCKEPYEL